MNKENKELVELIISKFKENSNGVMSQSEFGILFKNDHNLRLSIGRLLIEDLKLIDRIGTTNLRLTNKGWEFESFEKSEKSKNDKETLEYDLAKSNLEANKLNKEITERNIKNENHNRVTTWVNVILGLINIGILVWQTLKNK